MTILFTLFSFNTIGGLCGYLGISIARQVKEVNIVRHCNLLPSVRIYSMKIERGRPTPYQNLMQIIGEFQEESGSGGCFMEVLQVANSWGNIANMYNDQNTIDELTKLINSLPSLQTDEAQRLASITLNKIKNNMTMFPK